jgi:DNA-binding XRE family transcriptional regulator
MKIKTRKTPLIKGMVSHGEAMRCLRRDRPEIFKALKDPDPRVCLAWNVIGNRTGKGLTQRELAEKSGVSLRTIAYIEDYEEQFSPNIKIVQMIAKALGIKFTDLFNPVDLTEDWA